MTTNVDLCLKIFMLKENSKSDCQTGREKSMKWAHKIY